MKTYTSQVKITNSIIANGSYKTLQLKDLPSDESFKTHTSNALKSGEVSVNDGGFSLTTPPLSIFAVLLKADTKVSASHSILNNGFKAWQSNNGNIFFSYLQEKEAPIEVGLFDLNGNKMGKSLLVNCVQGTHQYQLNSRTLNSGLYFLRLKDENKSLCQKIFLH